MVLKSYENACVCVCGCTEHKHVHTHTHTQTHTHACTPTHTHACTCVCTHTHTHTNTHTHTHTHTFSYHVRNADQWGKKWILPRVNPRTVPMPVCSQTLIDQAWLPSRAPLSSPPPPSTPTPNPASMFALLFQWECCTVFTLAVCMLIDVVFHYPWSTPVPSFFLVRRLCPIFGIA